MHEVTAEERFLFDLQGFLILRGAIDRDLTDALDAAVVENEAKDHDESWAEGLPVVQGKHFTKDTDIDCQIRLNGLPRLDPIFDQLIAHPSYLLYLQEFIGEPQLVNTWSISKYEGRGASGWHNGLPIEEYTERNGTIRSPMLNVVTMLTPNHPGDGCFIVIPGSHKSNLKLDTKHWGTAGLDTPGAIEITGEPGDVMLFTEALRHAGAAKTTSRRRTHSAVQPPQSGRQHVGSPQRPALLDAAVNPPALHPGTAVPDALDELYLAGPRRAGG